MLYSRNTYHARWGKNRYLFSNKNNKVGLLSPNHRTENRISTAAGFEDILSLKEKPRQNFNISAEQTQTSHLLPTIRWQRWTSGTHADIVKLLHPGCWIA